MVHPNSLANLRPKPWKKGQSPNPGGRPKGALNTLSTKFIKDFMEHYNENGVEAINALCAEKPDKYVELAAKLALSVVPKDINVKSESVLDDYSKEQLAALHSDLRTVIGLAERGRGEADEAGGEGELSHIH